MQRTYRLNKQGNESKRCYVRAANIFMGLLFVFEIVFYYRESMACATAQEFFLFFVIFQHDNVAQWRTPDGGFIGQKCVRRCRHTCPDTFSLSTKMCKKLSKPQPQIKASDQLKKTMNSRFFLEFMVPILYPIE